MTLMKQTFKQVKQAVKFLKDLRNRFSLLRSSMYTG